MAPGHDRIAADTSSVRDISGFKGQADLSASLFPPVGDYSSHIPGQGKPGADKHAGPKGAGLALNDADKGLRAGMADLIPFNGSNSGVDGFLDNHENKAQKDQKRDTRRDGMAVAMGLAEIQNNAGKDDIRRAAEQQADRILADHGVGINSSAFTLSHYDANNPTAQKKSGVYS